MRESAGRPDADPSLEDVLVQIVGNLELADGRLHTDLGERDDAEREFRGRPDQLPRSYAA
jgi:hypothetical protein